MRSTISVTQVHDDPKWDNRPLHIVPVGGLVVGAPVMMESDLPDHRKGAAVRCGAILEIPNGTTEPSVYYVAESSSEVVQQLDEIASQ